MASNGETRKIMTKPLPQILDEIEESIGLADEAAKIAREAAVVAHKAGEKAAIEARKAGEKTIEEATVVLNKRIAKIEEAIGATNEHVVSVEQTGHNALRIGQNALQLAELLKAAITDGLLAVNKKISENVPDTKSVPKKVSKQ